MEEIMRKRQREVEEAYERQVLLRKCRQRQVVQHEMIQRTCTCRQWDEGRGSHHPDYDPEIIGPDVRKASRTTVRTNSLK
eukprot:scaffold241180_cov12-Tisochrysis_lutea.AAC.1